MDTDNRHDEWQSNNDDSVNKEECQDIRTDGGESYSSTNEQEFTQSPTDTSSSFKDIDHIAKSFAKFAGCVPSDGTVIAFDANPFVKSIIDDLECDVITFGFNEHCDYYASEISFNARGCPKFKVNYRGEELFEMHAAGQASVTAPAKLP